MSGAKLSMADWLWRNPEFLRLARSKLRSRSMLLFGGLSLLFFGGGLAAMFFFARMNLMKVSEMLKYYFFVGSSLQIAVVSLYGLNLATQNIVMERERFTYDFQRLVTMGPKRVTLGKIFGASLEAWFVVLCSFPFMAVPVLGGAVPLWVGLQGAVLVIAWGTFACAIGLAASAFAKKSTLAHGMAFLFAGTFFALAVVGSTVSEGEITLWSCWNPVMYLVGLSLEMKPHMAASSFEFMGFNQIPMVFGMLAMLGLFTSLLFAMTARRLADSELSMLSPRFAGICFGLMLIILMGGLESSMSDSPYTTLAAFHVISGTVLALLAFAMTPSAEMLYARLHRAERDQHWQVLREVRNRLEDNPPLMYLSLLGAMYSMLAVALAYQCSLGMSSEEGRNFVCWNVALSAMCVFGALSVASVLLYIQVYTEKGGLRAGLVVVLLSLAAPPLVLGILQMPETIHYVNPIALLVFFAESPALQGASGWERHFGAMTSMPLISFAAAVPLAVLCAMRIRYLLDIHQIEMKKMVDEEVSADMELPRLQALAREAAARAHKEKSPASAADQNPELEGPANAGADSAG